MHYKKDWNQFYIVTLLASFALYFTIVGFILHLFVVTTRNDIVAIGEKTTLAAVNEVNQFLKENIDVVQIASDGVEYLIENGGGVDEVRDFFTMTSEDYENKVNSLFTGFYGYIDDTYVDGTGWIPEEGYSAISRPWYKEAVEANGVSTITTPYDDVHSGEIRISSVRLLKDKKSVVAVDISLAKLNNLVNEIYKEGYGECMILDHTGTVVASSRNDLRLNYLNGDAGLDEQRLAERIFDQGEKNFEMRIDYKDYYVFSNPIYSGWQSIFIMPKATLYKDIRKNMGIAAAASLLLMALLLFFCNYSNRKRTASENTLRQIKAVSSIYAAVSEIDLNNRTFKNIYSLPHIKAVLGDGGDNADEMFKTIMHTTVAEEYITSVDEFTDLDTLGTRFKYISTNTLTHEFVGKVLGWCRARFIVVDYNEDHSPHRLLFAVEDISEAKKEEERLISESTVDKLTGCFNRKAYEETISYYMDNPMEDDLVYFSMDVNELKAVNDDLGHAVGDELIKGISECMRQALKPYGKVFRTGGDEFFAIIHVNESFIDGIYDDLLSKISNWHGKNIESGSASIGYARHADYKSLNIKELAKLADKFMYEDKERFYRKKGIDRRGQREAYDAICSLYQKILLVNLSDDHFQTLHIEESEKDESHGFRDHFSEWVKAFVEMGQVDEADKDIFVNTLEMSKLISYFDEGNASFKFSYRRKVGDEFKPVVMELTRAPKYVEGKRNIYLFIKVVE